MAMPHYSEIPDHWKQPVGPYRQAPQEFGGDWWLVNPFTGSEPWNNQPRPKEPLPEGFTSIFGPRPQLADYLNTPNPSQTLTRISILALARSQDTPPLLRIPRLFALNPAHHLRR